MPQVAPGVLRQRSFRLAIDLAVARVTTQLPGQLTDLSHAGCTHRVATTLKALAIRYKVPVPSELAHLDETKSKASLYE